MAEQKVNKKLLIVCGVLLVVGGVYFLYPFDKKDGNNQQVTSSQTTNQEIVNNIVKSPETPSIDIPSAQVNNVNLEKYSNKSYILSTEEVVNSKNSGLYNTYSDNADYVSNPYYQKYSYSKESGEQNVKITEYPKSFYGSLATQKDFTSEFPSSTQSSQNEGTSNEKPTETNEEEKPTETSQGEKPTAQ